MSDENLDPRIQKLVASLYGELPEDEEREFQGQLAGDAGLREEYETLRSARSLLGAWETGESAPGFVFVEERERPRAAGGRWSRLRGAMTPPAWGFAAAAALLAVLVASGFRMDRLPDGVAFRFGPPRTSIGAAPPSVAGVTLSPAPIDASPADAYPGVRGVQASEEGPYLTHDAMDAYTAQTAKVIASMLSDYEQRRNNELAYVLQTFYAEMADRQARSFDELRNQIQGVGLGLMAEQDRANRRLETLAGPDGTLAPPPVAPDTLGGEGHHDE